LPGGYPTAGDDKPNVEGLAWLSEAYLVVAAMTPEKALS
jgi:hypothetical protein